MSIEQIPTNAAAPGPGPSRAAASLKRGAADERSLPALRAALLARSRSHHPQADLGPVERAFDLAVEAHGGQRRASGEAVRHPPDRRGPDPGRPRHRPGRGPGRAPPRRAGGHRVQPDRRRGALRAGGRPARRRRHQAVQVQHPSPRGAAGREHPEDVPGDGRGHPGRPDQAGRPAPQHAHAAAPAATRSSCGSPARRWRSTRRWPSGSGIWQIKWELEDLAFKTLEPERVPRAGRAASTPGAGAARAYIERAIEVLRPELDAAGIEADLQGRPKHLYSIWKKMQRKGAEFGEIYDVYAIRVLVDEVRDCYAALGVVHSLWRPIPGQFDDYIAMPKNNLLPEPPHGGHRARRQAARDPDPDPRDAPGLRGRDRRALALQGGLARPTATTTRSWPGCASSWTGSATSADATEFVEGIKLDIFQDQVFVFTPKGDVKDLPAGSTPLDFAYRIHTDVGHRCIGAKVNNRLVPLDYRLKNGDIVEIVTTKARARSVARLAERSSGPATPGRRSGSGSSARNATRTSSTAASRSSASCGGWPGPSLAGDRPRADRGDRPALQPRRRSTTSTPRSATARSAPSRSSCAWASSTTPQLDPADGRAAASRRAPAASGSRAWATCWSGSPSAATRSRATRSSGSSPAARGSPSTCAAARRSSTSARRPA